MIIVSVSACSAVDANLTEDLNTQISNDEPLLVENNINEDISYNQNENELLDNQVDNDYLKANDSSDTYSFDDLDGWTSIGSVSLSDDGYDGSCVVLNQASISRDIDWSYVDKIGFWYKIPTRAGILKVTVGDDTLLSKTASTAITSWTYFEQNVSYTGSQALKFQGVVNNRASYIDSLVLTLKPKNQTYSFDDLDGWTSTGSVSLSDDGYDGSCVVLNQASISRDIDWSYVDKIGFWYKIPTRAGILKVTVGDDTLLSKTASTAITSWTYFEQNVSYTGSQTLKFQGVVNNRASYIDSLVLFFNYNKAPVKELIGTKFSSVLNDDKVIITLMDLDDNPISDVNINYTINNGNMLNNITNGDGQIVIRDVLMDVVIFANFTGNEDYIASNITVKILSTKLSLNSTDSCIIISLKDSEDKLISGAKIDYSVNDNDLMSVITNNQGQVIVRNVIGNVTIFASYSGNDKKYLKTNETEKCQVNHFEGNPFTNPYFDEGIDEVGNVYGWNITYGAAHDGSGIGGGVITGNDRNLMFSSNYYGYTISQYLNFDCIDKIFFKYFATNAAGTNYGKYDNLTIIIDGTSVESTHISRDDGWQEVIINVTDFNGYNLFKLSMSQLSGTGGTPYSIYFDDFTVEYTNRIISDFSYESSLVNDNISVKFTNSVIGNITSVLWNFGDGTNSSELNPIHIFSRGNYTVTLTASNENNNVVYSRVLSLDYPTINGQMYSTVQDALNNAVDGAIIEIPNDITEDLTINQNLTLNFNGNKLTGTINVNDGAIVTVTNISDVSSVATDDSSKLTITDSNINSNLELKSGNIDVNSVNFNDSVLTITSANATLVNVNVANGGVVVNGGKSKITNSNLTGSDLAISQTAGELEITNNIIKDNAKGIEITGGNATITFNAIYNNTNAFNSTNANVISKNNWYGTKTVTGTDSYLTMSITTDAVKMYPGEKYTIHVDLTQNNNEESTLSEGSLNTFTLEFTSPNGVTTPVTINNGKGTFEFTAGAISEDVKLTLFGEEYELEDASIVTKPIETNITITSSENGVVVICLTTVDGNVSGVSVKYIINGVDSTNVTDANGQIIINGLSGKIIINATFEGNETLLPSNMVNSFDFTEPTVDNKINSTQPTVNPSKTSTSTKIVKVASKITAKKKTFKAKTKTKKYQITLKTKSGKAIKKVKVTLKVKGKTYKATTNSKGKATFKITKLTKKGKYTAVIKFAGNKNYKATSKKVKLTVKK